MLPMSMSRSSSDGVMIRTSGFVDDVMFSHSGASCVFISIESITAETITWIATYFC